MGNFIIGMLNKIIAALASVLSGLVGILPNSPFQAIDNSQVGEFLNGLAWVLPIPQALAILEAWVVAIAAYMIYQLVLRWVKAIE